MKEFEEEFMKILEPYSKHEKEIPKGDARMKKMIVEMDEIILEQDEVDELKELIVVQDELIRKMERDTREVGSCFEEMYDNYENLKQSHGEVLQRTRCNTTESTVYGNNKA